MSTHLEYEDGISHTAVSLAPKSTQCHENHDKDEDKTTPACPCSRAWSANQLHDICPCSRVCCCTGPTFAKPPPPKTDFKCKGCALVKLLNDTWLSQFFAHEKSPKGFSLFALAKKKPATERHPPLAPKQEQPLEKRHARNLQYRTLQLLKCSKSKRVCHDTR